MVKLGKYAIDGDRSPSRRLLTEFPYLASFGVAVILCSLQIAVLTWTKVMLPIASPFWSDPLLANIDHAIFGIDPWIVANRVFGWAAPVIDRAYITWAPIKFATLLFVILMPDSSKRSRALISYFLMMAAVAIGQYFCSSAGPAFYEMLKLGPRFHGLPIEPWVAQTRDYLWDDHLRAGGAIGGGISAMPSLHVAATLWIGLVLQSYRREAGVAGFCYFGLITIGSVMLGWHYAVDSLVAVLITISAWCAAARLANPKPKHSQSGVLPLAPAVFSDDAQPIHGPLA
jgi:hypothetical protein